MAATFMIFTVTSNNNLILRYRKLHFGFTRFGKFIVGVIIKKSTKNELELFYLIIIKKTKNNNNTNTTAEGQYNLQRKRYYCFDWKIAFTRQFSNRIIQKLCAVYTSYL